MSSKSRKTANRSRHEREKLPPRPEFALTGIISGVVGGVLTSVVLETAMGKPARVVMMICGMAGLALGSAVEGIRYGWRYWKWRNDRRP